MAERRPTRLGDFELIARIAKGGMAEIYLARRQHAEQFELVVVKRILPHLAEEQEFVQMFLEEARLAAMISHPNVVRILDVGADGEDSFIAMEYIDGPTVGRLARHARRDHVPLPTAVAGSIVVQACQGLHAAHELRDESGDPLNLVHRDVSPHNLILSREGSLKLVDFGVAKAKNTTIRTHTGGLKGKFPYMSPEQSRGEPLDRRTDLFSLGTIFFELVTAERLFARPSELLTLKAISEEPIPDARSRMPELPDAFNAIIRTALAQKRSQRFSTAEEMGEATREAMRELGMEPSQELVADYLADAFADVLAKREATVRRLAQKPTGGMPPIVGNLPGDPDDPSDREADEVSTRKERGSLLKEAPAPQNPEEQWDDTIPAKGSTKKEEQGDPAETAADPLPPSPSPSIPPPNGSALRRVLVVGALAVLLGVILGLFYRQRNPPGPPLRFGLAPVYPEAMVRQELRPFISYLQRKLGRRVELVVTRRYRDLRMQLLAGKVDFASLTPLQFVRAKSADPSLRMLASSLKEGARTYQSYLLVRAGGGIKHVVQLRGKTICYVDKGSASGFLMARHYLRENGIDPRTALAASHYSGTHSDVLRDLLAGKCDAGASNAEAYRNARRLKLASSALKILAITGELPNDMLSPSPVLSAPDVARLKAALLNLEPARDLGQPVLAETYPTSAFVAPRPEDFQALAAADQMERRGR